MVNAPWVDRVYLSLTGELAGATALGTLTHNTPLAVGTSQTFSLQVTLPALADGDYRVLVVSDADGQVYEAQRESNNTSVSAAPLTLQHRDFTFTTLSAPTTATSGSVITIDRQVTNSGSAIVSGSWVDRYYLSRDGTLDGNDRLLAETPVAGSFATGAGYGGPLALTIPVDVSGAWFILAVTDAANAVTEVNAEGNNVSAVAINIALAPYADLVASNVTAPTLVIQDPARITVGWTVTNNGTGIGQTLQWTDTVLAVADNGSTVVLGSFDHSGALAVGESYRRSETLFAPPALTGHFTVSVRTDAQQVVFENNNQINNLASAPAAAGCDADSLCGFAGGGVRRADDRTVGYAAGGDMDGA